MAAVKATPLQKKITDIRAEAEERDAARRAARLSFPYADVRTHPPALEALKLVPEADARDAGAAVIEVKGHDLALAALNPRAPKTAALIAGLQAREFIVRAFVCSQGSLNEAWKGYGFVSNEGKDITGKVAIGKSRIESLLGALTTFDATQGALKKFDFTANTTTELLEIVLAGALANRASDIHLEAGQKKAKVRYRVDGILHDIATDIPLKNYGSLVSRIKLLSGLKINVRSEAQDGRFTIALPGKNIELRISVIPAEFGETIVARVLDPGAINVQLESLGLRPDDQAIVERNLKRPNGLILNTGPTGSGKTTTLYAFLRSVASTEIKVITVEDPVEYRIEGIEQTQVDEKAGYSFANGLKSILRQDPDVILVGEIRDAETADIAMQASLTGHLVFSTLHTNDAIGAVPRLIDLGAKPQTIGPALALIIAQRLVRRLCPACKKAVAIPAPLKSKIDAFMAALPARVDKTPFTATATYEPVGCAECNGSGYRGRIGIFEFLESDRVFAEAIIHDASWGSLKKLADAQGMVPMQSDGILKILAGMTSVAEVEEATGAIVW